MSSTWNAYGIEFLVGLSATMLAWAGEKRAHAVMCTVDLLCSEPLVVGTTQ